MNRFIKIIGGEWLILLITIVYILSILLQTAPLCKIILDRQLQKYFVYVTASTGFLFLNLIGSISTNVTAYKPIQLHFANLVISASFAVVYVILSRMKTKYLFVPLQERFTTSLPARHTLRLYLKGLALCSVASLILFSIQGALPLIFRFDLFGDWTLLVKERIRIVQHPGFYWFALGIFEIPLFLSIFCAVLFSIQRVYFAEAFIGNWKRYFILVATCSLLFSTIYLNKQYLMYLLVAIVLCHMIVANRLTVGKIALFSGVSMVLLLLLYRLYTGAVAVGSIVQIIFHRIFEVYAWAGAVAFDLYPDRFPYLMGTSIVNPRGIFPYKQVIVGDLIYPYIYEDIGFGNAPLPALYENYVNFGWWGILSGIVLIGIVIIALTYLSWTKDLFLFVTSIFLTVKTMLLWQAPFWFGLIEPTLAFLLCFLFALKFIVFRYGSGLSAKKRQ